MPHSKKEVFTLLGKPNWFLKNDRCFLKGILLRNGSKPNHLNAYGQEGSQPVFHIYIGHQTHNHCLMEKLVQKLYKLFAVFDTCFLFCKDYEIQKIKHQC